MAKRAKRQAKKKSMPKVTRRDVLKTAALAAVAAASAHGEEDAAARELELASITEWRDYSMVIGLEVPRVFSNEHSTGYRKYQHQTVKGTMSFGFNDAGRLVDVQFKDFVNMTHKLSNGKRVTYKVAMNDTSHLHRFNAIGSNSTEKFTVATFCFAIVAEPSYNIGELDEDNTMNLTFAGRGTIDSDGRVRSVRGYAAGTLGCGCYAYGHKSPTRVLGRDGATSTVDDVASVFGTWTLKLDIKPIAVYS